MPTQNTAQTNAIRSALGWAPARPIIAKEKIRTDHSRTRARKAQRVAAGPRTDVRNRQPAHLPHHTDHLGLFERHERIAVAVVHLRPAVVAWRVGTIIPGSSEGMLR